MNETLQEIKGLTKSQKLQWIERRKQIGDTHYKKKEFQQALNTYLNAIMGFTGENEDESFVELKVKILCNMAVAAFENKSYQQSLQFLDKAWNVKPKARILYLKSRCYEKEEIFD